MRLFLGLALVASAAAATTAKNCKLIAAPADKPFPSLTQCYKDNQRACCVSAHDQKISESYSSLLSGTCLREFPMLEMYYCLGCNLDQPKFISGTDNNDGGTCGNATLHVCQSFADNLFGFDTDPTGSPNGFKCPAASGKTGLCVNGMMQYDRCGFLSDSGAYLPSQTFAVDGTGTSFNCPAEGTCSITKAQITAAQDAFFAAIRPPFFEKDDNSNCSDKNTWKGYKIQIDASGTNCLSAASSIGFSPLAVAFALVAVFVSQR
jgi:hypothetical protein